MFTERKSKISKVLAAIMATLLALPLTDYLPVTYASTGDFSSDFVAAAPYSYDHVTGGGAFDDRTIGKDADVVESLESGDFKSYDIVTFFHQITVAETPAKDDDASQTIEIDYSFLADSTGTSGAGFSDIKGVYVNRGEIEDLIEGEDNEDEGNYEITEDSTASIFSEELDGILFEPKSVLKLTVKLDGLDYGETIIIRIDAEIRFKTGATPTGNIAASVDAMRLVEINSGTPVTKKNSIPTGAQTVPFKLKDYQLPVISIVKTTYGWNGTEYVWDDGVYIEKGADVKWKYTVTNPGTQSLSGISVTDDNGTPDDTSDDFNPGYITGDDGDGILEVGEEWIYEYTKKDSAVIGNYSNVATAIGYDGTRATDPATDPSSYFGVDSQISIVKTTYGWNGTEYVWDDGVVINSGSTVKWRYEVTNEGNVPLSNVVVTDDNGTPDDTSDDFNPGYITGDDGDGILQVGEEWIYEDTKEDSADEGTYNNIGTVKGNYLDHFTAEDYDPSSYEGVNSKINIEKTTRDAISGEYVDGARLVVGQTVMWQYVVTNPGNDPLSNVVVIDDNGTPDDTSDDFELELTSGDDGDDGILDVGEEWIYKYTSPDLDPAVEEYANTSSATATGSGPQPAEDSDSSWYTGYNIGIEVTKTFTAGPFADTEYTVYTIKNTSDPATPDGFLVKAKVYDPKLGIDIDPPYELYAGDEEDITLGTMNPDNTEQPKVDAWITIYDDESDPEDIHFYGEP